MIRAAVLVAVSLLIGCGGGGSDGEGDPATVVPADALFYMELVVRPEGSLRADALDAGRKLLSTDDPEARIRELLKRHAGDFDWEQDVEPWLGDRAAFWATPNEASGVMLLAVTDADAAHEAIESVAGPSPDERSYRGSEIVVDEEGVAASVVGDFMAIGRESEVVRTIDAARGESLAETGEYQDSIDLLVEDRLAHFWADVPGLLELAMRQEPELDRLRSLVPVGDLPPVVGAFLADGDRLALEVEARTALQTSGTPLLQELPGDAWAAAGAADVGESLRDAIDRFAGAFGGVALRGQLRRELGLDLDRDLLDWIGHAGVFVRGTTPETFDGGLVIEPTDEARAADAFGRLVGAIQQIRHMQAVPVDIDGADQAFAIQERGARLPVVLARGSGLVVATLGEPAAEAALGDGDRLGDAAAYAEAEELVGVEPSLLISMPQMLEVLDAAGAGPELAEMRRSLETVTVLAAGVSAGGDEARARLVAGLR